MGVHVDVYKDIKDTKIRQNTTHMKYFCMKNDFCKNRGANLDQAVPVPSTDKVGLMSLTFRNLLSFD